MSIFKKYKYLYVLRRRAMTIREAMEKRHMVRKYKDTVLPEEIVKKLNERI